MRRGLRLSYCVVQSCGCNVLCNVRALFCALLCGAVAKFFFTEFDCLFWNAGGTFSLLTHFLPGKAGISTTFVDITDPEAVRQAVRPNTKARGRDGGGARF